MQITQTMVINLITVLAAIGVGLYLKSRWRGVMAQVKEHLFTPHGIVIALIWGIIGVGVTSSVMFIRVSGGDDMSISYPTEEGIKQATKGRKG